MRITPDEQDALARWLRVAQHAYAPTMDKEIAPVVQRVLDEAEVGANLPPDPYAGKRTIVAGSDTLGGQVDRGITRKSERNQA